MKIIKSFLQQLKPVWNDIRGLFQKKAEEPKKKKRRRKFADLSELEKVAYFHDKSVKDKENTELLLDEYEAYTKEGKERIAEYVRQKSYRIPFEFIPKQQNFKNVRSYLHHTTGDYKAWKSIRDACEKKNGGVCQICGLDSKTLGVGHSTECHEVWEYDDRERLQKLTTLQALCIVCHKIKHINMSSNNEADFNQLLELYMLHNGVDKEQALNDYNFAIDEKKRRDYKKYQLELSYLEKYGIDFEPFNCHGAEFEIFIKNVFRGKAEGLD